MRRRTSGIILSMGVLAVLLLGVGCATEKSQATTYVPTKDEELYGTFLFPDGGKAVNGPGRWTNYVSSSGSQVLEEGTERIVKKWTDSTGDVWVQTYAETTGCGSAVPGRRCMEGLKVQTLNRFDKGGKVREWAVNLVASFSPMGFPSKIDPRGQGYRIAYRSTE